MGKTTSYFQQVKIRVRGVVRDRAGNPVPGVTIVEKGTQNGTVSTNDGSYAIAVNGNAVLVFTVVGMIKQEVEVNNRQKIDVVLQGNAVQLNEVVAVGYGTQNKKDLTGAISSVGIKDIQNQPASNIETLLQGKAAGVYIQKSSGAPGGTLSIQVRGRSSVNAGTEPLYVIDGVPVYNSNEDPGGSSYGTYSGTNALVSLNPDDIASIEVLKDASATAIYGSRGSNGVIIITTKRGNKDGANIRYNGYYGWQKVANKLKLMNGTEQAEFFNDWAEANSLPQPFANPESIGKGTDWQDEIFRTAPMQNHQISISNGKGKTQYYFSANYFDQQGIVIDSKLKRYSVRANVDEDLNEKLHFSQSFTFSRTISNAVPIADAGSGNVRSAAERAYVASPIVPVYDSSGNYVDNWYNASKAESPVGSLKSITSDLVGDNLLGNISLNYNIVNGLTFKTLLGVNLSNRSLKEYYPQSTTYIGGVLNGLGTLSERKINNILNENTLRFTRLVNKVHHIEILGGFTWQTEDDDSWDALTDGYPDDRLGVSTPGSATGVPQVDASYSKWSLASWLGRINYQYKDKYLLTATFRADGSSKFGTGNKWGFFPSVAAGYRLSEEQFIKNINFFDDLKIRASYGLTGNQQIGTYKSLPQIINTVTYIFNNQLVSGSRQTNLGNSNLRWEKSGQWDAGVDASFLHNRIRLTVDYYQKVTHDLLFTINLPANSGYTQALYNTGTLSNKGFELDLNADIFNRDFKWNIDANYSNNRTKMVSLGLSGSTSLFVGFPPGAYLGYVYEGVFNNQKEIDDQTVQTGVKPGDARYLDVSGDGKLNADDRIVMGKPNPDYIFGINNSFSYKGISLSVFVQGVIGKQGKKIAAVFDPSEASSNKSIDLLNRWTPNNPGSNIPRAGFSDRLSPSTYDLISLSYVKIRNIQLGYNIPSKLIPRLGSVNVYVSGDNLFTFTKYTGYDPDGGSDYPTSSTVILGLNIQF